MAISASLSVSAFLTGDNSSTTIDINLLNEPISPKPPSTPSGIFGFTLVQGPSSPLPLMTASLSKNILTLTFSEALKDPSNGQYQISGLLLY